MGIRYPQPDNEVEFEKCCLKFYREFLKRETLILYGKRGENQDGIDIIDQINASPVYAIQCKHRESHKTLTPREIKAEVKKAEASQHSIDHYVIATTAKKSRAAQDAVIELNQRVNRQFTVEVDYWDDICDRAMEFGRLVAEIIVYGSPVVTTAVADTQSTASRIPPSTDVSSDAIYADIETLLVQRRLDVAEHEIDKLPDPESNADLSNEAKYAIFRLRAKLALEQATFEQASQLFHLAFSVRPDLEQAQQNRLLAFELENDNVRAFAEAVKLAENGVRTAIVAAAVVRNATTLDQLSEHKTLIEEFIDSDEGLNVALTLKNLTLGNHEDAWHAAERAFKIAPESVRWTPILGRRMGLFKVWLGWRPARPIPKVSHGRCVREHSPF